MTAFDRDAFGSRPAVIGEPIDIKPRLADGEDFPIDKMPPRLAAAINAIVDIVQVPMSLAAQSVLSACSLIAQTKVMIELPTREIVPPSLYLFTIAASGDRKTTADKQALGPVYDVERDLRRGHEPAQLKYTLDKAAYDAAVASAKKGTKDKDQIRRNLELCGDPPSPPALPMLLVEDPTIEGVVKLLDEAYPSIGLFSDEGAKMLGGYSMQEDRQASTGAALSQLWDGKPIKRVRGTDVTKILDGRRVSLHLMVQPGVANKLFGNKAIRDQGLLSRMLVTAPKSLKGQRLWHEPSDASWAALADYRARAENLLRNCMAGLHPATREITFETMTLQPAARAMWIEFSDNLERQQAKGGDLHVVSDLASKMGQHAIRLAAVLAYYEAGGTAVRDGISEGAMAVGIALGEFYLAEALRLFDAGSVSEDSDNAAALIEFIHGEKLDQVGKRWLSQNCPKHLRPAETLKRALDLLVMHGHLFPVEGRAEFSARGRVHAERNVFTVVYPDDGR